MESVVVLAQGDAPGVGQTLMSIAEATRRAPDVAFEVIVLVDGQRAGEEVARSADGLDARVVDVEGLSKWAAIARGTDLATSATPTTLYAGESYAVTLKALGLDAVAEAEAARREADAAAVPEQLSALNVILQGGDAFHPETVFEGSSSWFGRIDNDRPAHFGAFSYSISAITHSVTRIGRYSSISWDVLFGAAEHPMDFLSTSPFIYEPHIPPFDVLWREAGLPTTPAADFTKEQQERDIRIGHDVWIGARASIKAGVSLGDGCVVGTGAVVTRDVPPYAVVAGVPARVVRLRFEEAVVERLLEHRWWRFDPVTLSRFPLTDPERSIDLLQEAEASGAITPWEPERRPLLTVVPGLAP